MTLLDRYIARQFLGNIVLLFVFLFAVIVVIDFSLNFDEFTDVADQISNERGWAKGQVRETLLACVLVIDLWWPRLFQLFHYMLGIVLVGALGFTCAQMVRYHEFVAILAGGVSLHRVARPILGVALLMTVLQVVNAEVVLPHLAPLLTRDKNLAGRRGMGAQRQPLSADSSGRLFYAKRVDMDTGTIQGLWVWERDERGLMTRRITADHATWDGSGWRLQGGLAQDRSVSPQAGLLRNTPIDHVQTDLDPTTLRLRRFEGYSHNLSSAQIGELLARLREQPRPPVQRMDQLERVRAGRPATMAANLLALMVVLPFFVRREPSNMLVQGLKGTPVGLAAVLGTLVGVTAAVPGLPPAVGVFLPVVVLLPLAIAGMSGIKT